MATEAPIPKPKTVIKPEDVVPASSKHDAVMATSVNELPKI